MHKLIFFILFKVIFLTVILNITVLELRAQEIVSSKGPGARWGHVIMYDPINDNLMLFGGRNKKGGAYLRDTWIWDNNEWKELKVTGPSARGFCAITLHKKRKAIILHGGRGNNSISYSDLWEWDGKNWHELEKSSSYKADHHQMVYLENTNAILAYGGWNGENVSGDSWLWDGEWKVLEIESPPGRASFAMTYNDSSNSVLLFGGLWINGQYADLWEWFENKWSPLGGPYDNSSLDHHNAIYDRMTKKIIGFGGKNYRYVTQNKTFTFENNRVKILNIEGPPARHSFGFTYDTKNNIGYLYGGKVNENNNQIPLGDFWKWEDGKWSKVYLPN